ncbi:MAG: hypothetical protein KBH81_13495 [Phycisphaerae bacterium]|nr:hypothetical protein [Phycisphaerae bacterium]HPC21361.1 hypothetical protein [Phycisphaerae bacterium]HRS29636.1 hypothetical protein [Phycisphaerae bacterium]HRT43328.1 hypothetical protein [Phycisphaerae bacterium]
MNWKALLQETLSGLARTHAQEPLSEIQRILRGVLGLDEIQFQGPDGHELRADTTLQQALEQYAAVAVKLQIKPVAAPAAAPSAAAPAAESRFREGAPAADVSKLSMDERTDMFLREFMRLENRHDFMWAGYIVRELLPRLGFAPEEAKLVLDHLRAEKLVTISKVPNPKNPDFPATGVHLNREHPRVKALLASHPRNDGATAAPPVRESREAPAASPQP